MKKPDLCRIVAILAGAMWLAGCTGSAASGALPTPTPSRLSAPALSPGMVHMMAALPDQDVPVASETLGNQLLPYEIEDGVKVFEITARPVRWTFMEGVEQVAWTYNGTVPGPMIRVTEGERVRFVVRNELPEDTTIHWHGIEVPHAMDGVPDVSQAPIAPGETFVYEFEAKPAGTFWYHSHVDPDIQIGAGLHGAFIIDPVLPQAEPPDVDRVLILNEWRFSGGQTYGAMPMAGMDPNYFTINGKAFPSTETITAKVGDTVRLRFIAAGQFVHPMHLHGVPFKIVATDGHPVPEAARLVKDTVAVAPGERYDIEFEVTAPGSWMLHCHISHHTTNDGEEPGGLMLMIDVES